MSTSLIVGDIHLGKSVQIGKPGIGNAINSRIADQVKLLDWVVDRAIDEHANSIILTGDICESVKPDYILLELFVDFLKKCDTHSIEVHIIAGNHDLKRTGVRYASYLDLIASFEMPNVYIYKNISTIFRNNIAFTMVPFRDMRSLNCTENNKALEKISSLLTYELSSIPYGYTKVVVGHLAIEGSIYIGDEFDNLSNELMCPTSMFEGYDYTFMGHVHKPQELEEEPYVAHVGSLDISDFGETDHKKIIISFDDDKDPKFKEITVPTRPLRHISINVPASVDSTVYVLKHIKAVHKNTPLDDSITKIEIKLLDEDSDGSDRQEIEQEAYNLGAFHVILTESKMLSAKPINAQVQVSNEIKPGAAVEIYAEIESFISDKEKNDFVNYCKSIINEYESQKQR